MVEVTHKTRTDNLYDGLVVVHETGIWIFILLGCEKTHSCGWTIRISAY